MIVYNLFFNYNKRETKCSHKDFKVEIKCDVVHTREKHVGSEDTMISRLIPWVKEKVINKHSTKNCSGLVEKKVWNKNMWSVLSKIIEKHPVVGFVEKWCS